MMFGHVGSWAVLAGWSPMGPQRKVAERVLLQLSSPVTAPMIDFPNPWSAIADSGRKFPERVSPWMPSKHAFGIQSRAFPRILAAYSSRSCFSQSWAASKYTEMAFSGPPKSAAILVDPGNSVRIVSHLESRTVRNHARILFSDRFKKKR